jgi:hypothetical protein
VPWTSDIITSGGREREEEEEDGDERGHNM